jgi:hypothetical protein
MSHPVTLLDMAHGTAGEKDTRNLKKADTPILADIQIHHNYVRPHMALNYRTAADLPGIRVDGENKWLTLIQNAVKNRKA